MGTYLSKPVLEKHTENDAVLDCPTTPLAWACVDMQGWRKTMEDAHVANTLVTPPPQILFQDRHDALIFNASIGNNIGGTLGKPKKVDSKQPECVAVNQNGRAKVFAVFDGHGGAEVAKFCDRYLVQVLISQTKWKEGDICGSLVDSFHELDRMIDHPNRKDELMQLKMGQMNIGHARVNANIKPSLENAPPLAAARATITDIIKSPFQQRRGKKDKDPNSSNQQQQNTSINDDLEKSTTQTIESPSLTLMEGEAATISTKEGESHNNDLNVDGQEIEEEKANIIPTAESPKPNAEYSTPLASNLMTDNVPTTESDVSTMNGNTETSNTEDVIFKDVRNVADSIAFIGDQGQGDDSNDDLEIMNVDDDENTNRNGLAISRSPDAKLLLQKLLEISESVDKLESGKHLLMQQYNTGDAVDTDDNVDTTTTDQPKRNENSLMTPTDTPSLMQNGRKICNLPDHPIHAGCTSIVVVITENILTIANAGDSRAVLCRKGGVSKTLSVDHKPMQPREMDRITRAGGFINHFGRVNGNLNLSRSIGDLKYKQTAGLPPSEQMITAEPDIAQIKLEGGDEFIILGCDGIWDCLTNDAAVQYVRSRIHTKSPKEIGIEMLDDIVSVDPKATQGIGGDNMTVLIVDLLPKTRTYNKEENSKSDNEN